MENNILTEEISRLLEIMNLDKKSSKILLEQESELLFEAGPPGSTLFDELLGIGFKSMEKTAARGGEKIIAAGAKNISKEFEKFFDQTLLRASATESELMAALRSGLSKSPALQREFAQKLIEKSSVFKNDYAQAMAKVFAEKSGKKPNFATLAKNYGDDFAKLVQQKYEERLALMGKGTGAVPGKSTKPNVADIEGYSPERMANIGRNSNTPEEITKDFLPIIENDLKRTNLYKKLTPEHKKLVAEQIYAELKRVANERAVISDQLLKDNEQTFIALEDMWKNNAIKPSEKIKMIQKEVESLPLEWGPTDAQWWLNYMVPFRNPSTGKMINPLDFKSSKDGFWVYFKKYLIINALFTAGIFIKRSVNAKDNSWDEVPGDNYFEKFMNVYDPIRPIISTFIPLPTRALLALGKKTIYDPLTPDFRHVSKEELKTFLLPTNIDVNNETKYKIVIDKENNKTYLKDSSDNTIGTYQYDIKNEKIKVLNGLDPEKKPTPSTSTTPSTPTETPEEKLEKLKRELKSKFLSPNASYSNYERYTDEQFSKFVFSNYDESAQTVEYIWDNNNDYKGTLSKTNDGYWADPMYIDSSTKKLKRPIPR